MLIIAIDDEHAALAVLEKAIRQAAPEADVRGFETAREALAFAAGQPVDVAFVDIRMPEIDGLSLATQLKESHAGINIIFVTGYSQYMVDAFAMHASGYVTKPPSTQAIRDEIENLRYQPAAPPAGQVYVQCFGNFAVYARGSLVHFTRAKPKELLAYLVHKNGAAVRLSEVASILWPEKEYNRSTRSQAQTAIAQMMATLRGAGIEAMITKQWNSIAVSKGMLDCDYYDFLGGNQQTLNTYLGEYLAEYSWAAATAMQLARIAAR